MTRVLFVDDDPDVFDNLRHLLHRQERQWDMVFAPGPDAGLAELARAPADVMVSDIRMPGMGGAGFLARVRDLYPGSARIVLSGGVDAPLDRPTLPFAHQYLGKPCRTNHLVDVVNRTASLYTHLTIRCCGGSARAASRRDIGFRDGCGIRPDLARWSQLAREESQARE